MDSEFQFDREKLLAAVHYVCRSCEPSKLGRVKLHRILYLADMLHYMATGAPLTGEDYRKQDFGPAAKHLHWALRALRHRSLLEVRNRKVHGFLKQDFLARGTIESPRLTDGERKVIDDVVQFVSGGTVNELAELNIDAAWKLVERGASIPYFTAYGLAPPKEVTEEDLAWGEAEARRLLPDVA